MEELNILNKEQKEAVDVIRAYLDDPAPTRQFITVSGPGGSGKTFMLYYALNTYNPQRVLGATISHFAKKVLNESLRGKYQISTVAAMLGLTITYNAETGEDMIVQRTDKRGNPITPIMAMFDIIIIDEASMIDDGLFATLMKYGKKIIAVGDKYQLPPVEQNHDSKFFDTIDAELVQVMRFNDVIVEFTSIFREEIARHNIGYNIDKHAVTKQTSGRTSVLDDTGAGYIFLNDIKQLLGLAYRDFKQDPVGIDGCRIIAYKNKTIDVLNNTIRKLLYGKDRKVYEVGELIISDGGFGKLITNGDIFRVIDVKEFEDKHGIHCYMLKLNVTLPYPVVVVSEKGQQQFDELEEYYKNMAQGSRQWKVYKEFTRSYARFKYSYAISVHKAQGASIKNVYVFEGEIMGVKPTTMKEKFQSLYVATTRAKHRVYVYNKVNSVNNSEVDISQNIYLDEGTKEISD